jgi:hypothetical protein
VISIVAYLWRGDDPRRVFLPGHANVLAAQFRRTLSLPHRFVCVSDEADGFSGVEVIKTPPECAAMGEIKSPEGGRFPSCYRRLWTFSDAAKALGERVLLVDIDLVVLRDMAPLLNRSDDFVGWRPLAHWGKADRIGGGMYLLKTGSRTKVWNDFRGAESIKRARAANYRGSDQAWLSYCLGRTATVWPRNCGLYSIRDFDNGRKPLPRDAVAVQWNGPVKPWQSSLPWVKEHWV